MNHAHARSRSVVGASQPVATGPYVYGETLRRFATSEFASDNNCRRTPRLLDMCCGSGGLASSFLKSGWDVVGLDHSAALVASALNTCYPAKTDGRFATHCDLVDYSPDPSSFDLIVVLDDTESHLGSLDALLTFLQQSFTGLMLGGHVVFRAMDIDSSPSPRLILAIMRDAGFLASWASSPLFPAEPLADIDEPFRGLYVGRRDI